MSTWNSGFLHALSQLKTKGSSHLSLALVAALVITSITLSSRASLAASKAESGLANTYRVAEHPPLNADGGLFENADLVKEGSAGLAAHTVTHGSTYGPLRLLHTYICLNPVGISFQDCSNTYPSTPQYLSKQDLANIDSYLGKLQPAGVKVILRFTYNFPHGNSSHGDDAPLQVILTDIERLQPIVRKHASVIYALEVGFVGYWGEEHNSTGGVPSTSHPDGNNNIPDMKRILEKEAETFGPYVVLLERDPIVLKAIEPADGPTSGIHDDRLAGDSTDAGTWKNKPYLEVGGFSYPESAIWGFGKERSAYAPFVGTFGVIPPYTKLQNCNELPDYFADIHLNATNVGAGAGPKVFDAIKDCIPEIFNKLGPSISLVSAKTDVIPAAGRTVHVDLRFTNNGYSRLFVRHPAYIVLTDDRGRPLPIEEFPPVRLDVDFTKLAPDHSVDVSTTLTFDECLSSRQQLHLALWMPDHHKDLWHDKRYNYLLNNENVPDPVSGLNVLFSFDPGGKAQRSATK